MHPVAPGLLGACTIVKLALQSHKGARTLDLALLGWQLTRVLACTRQHMLVNMVPTSSTWLPAIGLHANCCMPTDDAGDSACPHHLT